MKNSTMIAVLLLLTPCAMAYTGSTSTSAGPMSNTGPTVNSGATVNTNAVNRQTGSPGTPVKSTSSTTNNNPSNQPATPPTGTGKDAVINSDVLSKFSGDEALATYAITATTNNGVVTLDGTVDSQAKADQAIAAARSVSGVAEVKSNIRVQ